MRARFVPVLGIMAIMLMAVLGVSSPASAQATCQSATGVTVGGYNTSGGTAASSDGTVTPGERITVSGSGFAGCSTGDVLLFSAPTNLGRFQADAFGNVSVTVTIPAGITPGNHTIVLQGVDPTGNGIAPSTNVVVPGGTTGTGDQARGGTGTGGTGTGGTGLARTGAQIAGLTGAGVLMIGTGLVLFRQRRRRVVA